MLPRRWALTTVSRASQYISTAPVIKPRMKPSTKIPVVIIVPHPEFSTLHNLNNMTRSLSLDMPLSFLREGSNPCTKSSASIKNATSFLVKVVLATVLLRSQIELQ